MIFASGSYGEVMLATLPMYDWPEVRAAVDSLWASVARHAGIEAQVSHDILHGADWRRRDLVFSQTCGYPYTHEFRGRLNYIATPHYRADGCHGADYCSILLARSPMTLAAFAGSIAVTARSPRSIFRASADQKRMTPIAGPSTTRPASVLCSV